MRKLLSTQFLTAVKPTPVASINLTPKIPFKGSEIYKKLEQTLA
jgi:hypothetical protein